MKLHIGCGKRDFGPEWFHVDGEKKFSHVAHHNIFKLPQLDESVDVVYSSHLIEYFDSEEVMVLLTEWRRVLKTGGVLRLAVPDFEAMTRLYVDKKVNLRQIRGPLYGKMSLNESKIFHKTTYDFDTLKELLQDLGMRNVRRYSWQDTDHASIDDHSQAYMPHMDKVNGTLISLNVECDK